VNYRAFSVSAKEAARIIQPSLRSLDIYYESSFDNFIPDASFTAFVQAIEKSDIECLKIGLVEKRHLVRRWLVCILKMQKLRQVKIEVGGEEFDETEMFAMLKKSSTLEHADLTWNYMDTIDEAEEEQLKCAWNRNRGMDAWIDKPASMDAGLRPIAFAQGWKSGPDKVFQALVATAPKLVEPIIRSNRRKLPAVNDSSKKVSTSRDEELHLAGDLEKLKLFA